ncbi:MAG: hypothetical protein M3R52_03355 [Acidobacteriota bacterium]|nr:hypothetical protein [Acidobacteriota bacterium]
MEQELALALRERAVSALETSTTMLKVAQSLLKQGNQTEADRLRNEARYKRNESILLMDQARAVEHRSSNVLQFPPRKTPAASAEESQSLKGEGSRRVGTG